MDNVCVYVYLKVVYFWFMFGYGLLGFFFYIIRNCVYIRKFVFSVDCFIIFFLKCWKFVYLILLLYVWFKDNDEVKKKERMILLYLEIYILCRNDILVFLY